MTYFDGRRYHDDPEEPTAHHHVHGIDSVGFGIGDVVDHRAQLPDVLAELVDWYGVRAVTIKGPCYGGERCL